jgi:phosphoserine phosphatase RsbU/P
LGYNSFQNDDGLLLKLGLQGRLLLAVLAVSLAALLLALFAGARVLDSIRSNLGTAYAKNVTLLSKQRVLAPVARELALSERLAGSEVVKQWILDGKNPGKKALLFKEVAGYQHDFANKSYFLISALSGDYYFNDAKTPYSEQARYKLDPKNKNDSWFYGSLKTTKQFNLNVNPDVKLKVTNVWFNVIVYNNGQKIGIAGTGLNISSFLNDFTKNAEPGVTPIITDETGRIQAHPDAKLIAYNTAAGSELGNTFQKLLETDGDRIVAENLMKQAVQVPAQVLTSWVSTGGLKRLLAVSYDPNLHWHFMSLVDLNTARVLDPSWLLPLGLGGLLLLLAVAGGFSFTANRMVLQPLQTLTTSAKRVAGGQYDIALPKASDNEIGDLTRAFDTMILEVKSHTNDLEEKVQARTQDLSKANAGLALANKNISDSIDYASLIQRSILPASLEPHGFALWLPRDVVGGDFYLYRQLEQGYLFGVVDCAGHGVPGACMTMLAHAMLENVLNTNDPKNPAGVLQALDTAIRHAIQAQSKTIATNMDVGLVFVDTSTRTLTFSGAKTALYTIQDSKLEVIKGGRRAVGDTRALEVTNTMLVVGANTTCYINTDGFLDQAGGEKGFGLGEQGFTDLLTKITSSEIFDQKALLQNALTTFKGSHAQRDDITVLGMKIL